MNQTNQITRHPSPPRKPQSSSAVAMDSGFRRNDGGGIFRSLLGTMLVTTALVTSTLAPLPGIAQTAMNHGAMPMADAAAMSDGEVRKIDKETGKITLKHGPIKHLDMPPMSMVFTAKDKALLDKVKVGDKVRFHAVDEGGKLVVTDIQPAK